MEIIRKTEHRYTLGVAYAPGSASDVSTHDSEGDWATAQTIQKAAWDFVSNLDNGDGVNDSHITTTDGLGVGRVVESYIAPTDLVIDGQQIKKNSWLLGVVWQPHYWDLIKAGERLGLSIEGQGKKV